MYTRVHILFCRYLWEFFIYGERLDGNSSIRLEIPCPALGFGLSGEGGALESRGSLQMNVPEIPGR